jgi:uncharacterized membrane protein
MSQSDLLLQKRIDSIDILRGIAMVVMALDHVRDYFHITANTADPLDLNTTTPALFFTRWITHFCAPIFVFLSGTSIFLQSLRKTKSELSSFLIKRGLWLIFAEVAIITFGWSFNPYYNFHFLQVIWAIGISMVMLGILIWLPYNIILVLGLIIVLGHNLFDIPESDLGFTPNFWWDLLHHGFFTPYSYAPGHSVLIIYPFVAWTGVMMLGYCAGIFFTTDYTPSQRKKLLNITGFVLILFFIVLRFYNIYGDPKPWKPQDSLLHSFFSFISVNKYPPSLLFLFVTIGPSLLLLAVLEQTQNRVTQIFKVYGRTAFFYYILHIYLIHLLATISFFLNGHTMVDVSNIGQQFPFLFLVPGEGYGLPVVYLVWLLVVVMLYPVCKCYDRYKSAHKEKWWLSYL